MTLNYNGGTHEVVIYKAGQKFDRTNLPYFFNSITMVKATVRAAGISSVEIELSPSFQDGIQILKSGLLGVSMGSSEQVPSPVGSGGNTNISPQAIDQAISGGFSAGGSGGDKEAMLASVSPYAAVRFLYPGVTDSDGSEATTPWFTGPILAPPALKVSNSDISMTIGFNSSMMLLTGVSGTSIFKNEPALEILKKLVAPIGLKVTFDDDDSQTEAKLSSTLISGIVNQSRWATIKDILFRLNMDFITGDGEGKKAASELRIKSRKAIHDKNIDFTFVQHRQIAPGSDVIPVFNADISGKGMGSFFLPGSVFGTFQRSVDTSKKEVSTVVFNPSDIDIKISKSGDSIGGTLPAGQMVGGGATGIVDGSDPEIAGDSLPVLKSQDVDTQEEVKAESQKNIAYDVEYDLTVPGLPKLKALRKAQFIFHDNVPGISAVGTITEFSHISSDQGWVSEVKMRRGGGLGDLSQASVSTDSVKQPQAPQSGVSVTPQSV